MFDEVLCEVSCALVVPASLGVRLQRHPVASTHLDEHRRVWVVVADLVVLYRRALVEITYHHSRHLQCLEHPDMLAFYHRGFVYDHRLVFVTYLAGVLVLACPDHVLQ